MPCKYCYQETIWKTGEPVFNDDGTPSMLCDIDCLPIRGRLQRLVYSCICEGTKIAEIVLRVQAKDPGIAQANISRALGNLKKHGYIKEGQDTNGVRVFTTAKALENGDVEHFAYSSEKQNPQVKMLRHLLFWLLSRRTPGKHNQCALDDSDLVYLANIALTEWDDGSSDEWSFADTFMYMEPVVKKLRYIVHDLSGKRVPIPESVGEAERIDNWQTRTMTPLWKAKKPSKGWKVYQPYFADEWDRLCNSGEVHPDAKRYGENETERNAKADEWAKRFVEAMTGSV